jgi:hypothetical protein
LPSCCTIRARRPAPEGFWSRGNAALCAIVDVFIEMHHVSRATAPDRRRRLLAFSEFEETPRRLIVKLNEAGTDYMALAASPKTRPTRTWQGIRSRWPEDKAKPSPATLYRWLAGVGREPRPGGRRRQRFAPQAVSLLAQEPKGACRAGLGGLGKPFVILFPFSAWTGPGLLLSWSLPWM